MTYELIRILVAMLVSITVMVLLTRYLNLHAFFSLLVACLILGLIVGKPVEEILAAMQTGFGTLLQQIGFIVALGSCLGIVMEKTGAMEVISHKTIYLFGARRATFAMTMIGVLVGIPVFCDSGFIILSRLIPTIAAEASVNPAQLSLALSTGLYTTHTLVPPTPGPLAAAANFGVDGNLGMVILVGLLGSIPVALVSYYFSKNIGKNISLDLKTGDHVTIRTLSPWKAFAPLVLPIVLITLGSLPKAFDWEGALPAFITVVGQPVIALMIGLLLAATLIPNSEKTTWPSWIAEALKDAGVILLITGAGGAFGFVIKSSGIDIILKESISGSDAYGVIFLLIAYLIAAVLKTAQGSTTSSMIITSSLLAPLAASAGFQSPVDLAFLLIAVGGGAMSVSHANDSYFWVISQFSGFSPKDAFRSFTLITLLQGLTALATSIILFLIW